MRNNNALSDIEKILQTQTWKLKKLPSLQSLKRPVKIRSITEKEKPRKQERLTTQPCPVQEVSPEPSPQVLNFFTNAKAGTQLKKNETGRTLSCLAVPFNIISHAVTTVAAKTHSFDFHVPVFPKRKFGCSYKNTDSTPKFECVHLGFPEEEIMRLKVESGRISQNSQRKIKKKFPFLEDFQLISKENLIKTDRGLY